MPQPMARTTKAAALLPSELSSEMPSGAQVAREELLALSAQMAREGLSLVERVLPAAPEDYTQWQHYPAGDAIDPVSGARWFYHAHPPEQRGPREHGHFHLFLPLSAFEGVEPLARPTKAGVATVVHAAALCFDVDGLPTGWIATNHWVTKEHMMPAEAVIARLPALDLTRAGEAQGIGGVGRWLTLALAAQRGDIATMLLRRDEALAKSGGPHERKAEILASVEFAL